MSLLFSWIYIHMMSLVSERLLECFNSCWQLIDKTTLIDVILPQVNSFPQIFDRLVSFLFLSSLSLLMEFKDDSSTLSLIRLTGVMLVLGADVIVVGQRKQMFPVHFVI